MTVASRVDSSADNQAEPQRPQDVGAGREPGVPVEGEATPLHAEAGAIEREGDEDERAAGAGST